jgi:hypothetical protein
VCLHVICDIHRVKSMSRPESRSCIQADAEYPYLWIGAQLIIIIIIIIIIIHMLMSEQQNSSTHLRVLLVLTDRSILARSN